MAHILDADYLNSGKPDGEPLELDRQATVLQLARTGHQQSLKAWKRFAEFSPVEAEQVIKHVDGELVKTSKAAKPQKAKRGRGLKAAAVSREDLVRADLAADLNHYDPARREAARGALARLGGAR